MGSDVKQLLEQASRCGLVTPAVAEEFLTRLQGNPTLSGADAASRVIESKVLSAFQVEQLVAGRGEECVLAGRYHLLEKIGEGGMGAVYKARDAKLDRVVALKVLPAHRLNDADAVARFQREAKALARLSHPNIIQAYDSGEDRDRHFLVMEFVEGQSLQQVLRQHGALPATVAADFVHQAALGLQHAHEKGLIHRDIKPGNLLVAGAAGLRSTNEVTVAFRPGSQPWKAGPAVVKVLDLGLARFLKDQLGDSQLTQEGMGVGTPDYMAPEQFRDALHADVRTDVYGLGCTLYHLVAGQVPFPGSSHVEKAHAHAKKEPITLEERCPEAPGGLALVVARMMAKHPDERYQTAGEVADALAPYVAGASQSMMRLRQTGLWQAPPRPSRRRRALAWASGIAIVALVLAALVVAEPWRQSAANSDAASPSKSAGPPSQVVTIDNGLTVAKDGSGQFAIIGDALERIKPGQTIRVLDAAVYREELMLSPTSHRGVTLESIHGAVISVTGPDHGASILIDGVVGFVLRGFKLRGDTASITAVQVKGRAPGVRLERLETDPGAFPDYEGVLLDGVVADPEAPVVVQNCVFRRARMAVTVRGCTPDSTAAVPCSHVVVRNNRIQGPSGHGMKVMGEVHHVHVVGNTFWGPARFGAVQLEHLMERAEDVLIANNTVFESSPAFRLWDGAVRGKDVMLRNNLFLGMRGADMVFLDSGFNQLSLKGPGDGALLAKSWDLRCNWREGKRPTGTDVFSKSWVPPGSGDVLQEQIAVLSREPTEPNFLRPAKDSPLATGGAGGDLPGYVGAVPPEGVEPWNWDKTWKARENQSKK